MKLVMASNTQNLPFFSFLENTFDHFDRNTVFLRQLKQSNQNTYIWDRKYKTQVFTFHVTISSVNKKGYEV